MDAITMDGFAKLLASDESSLLEALRKLTQLEDTETIRKSLTDMLSVWQWRIG